MLAWLSLDGNAVNSEMFADCQFETPHWQPDHQDVFTQGPLGFFATQRFITPQCKAGLMPYHHTQSGCVINADVYLTHRETLCTLLEKDLETADVILILQAYLKWGEQCTQYLSGQFCFMIWDPRNQHLFIAVDPFAHCPLFYLHRPKKFLLLANECSPFHILCPGLALNERRLVEFAQDIHSPTETAYAEIYKLSPGHQILINTQRWQKTCYWSWKEKRHTLPYHTREQYYLAFQSHFKNAIQNTLRRMGPLTTQLSGGLDSSAVTAQAAVLLKHQNEPIFAFTSVPSGLTGESYRPGWYYHELHRIEDLVKKYANIQHIIYTATPDTDIFKKLQPLQRCFDQPLRNINNLDWTLATYETVLANQGRVLLIGAGGNGTISWTGSSLLEFFNGVYGLLKAKILHRPVHWHFNLHESMLTGHLTAPLRASVYPLQLWYGVRRLDPTQDLPLAIFCYNVPQWVYRKGKYPLQQRLLTREGLQTLLPESIAQNPYRGEQGADWYLHYNMHAKKWQNQLLRLPKKVQKILWQCYDQQKIMSLFAAYPFLNDPPDREATRDLSQYLLRCLSVGFYVQ